MAKKSVVGYVKSLIQKGYDISAIRNVMLKYGYSNKEIDDAISSGFKPTIRHEIHLSSATILIILFIFISSVGAALFFYYKASPEAPIKLLDFNLEPVKTTVEAGNDVIFIKELSNLGSSKRYDVIIKQEIIDAKTSKILTQKIETRAIETFGSTQTRILVPKDAKAGDYVLRVIVEYGSKKAVATLPVKITAPAKKEELREEEPKIIVECDDNNNCTEDIVEEGICVNRQILGCPKAEVPQLISTESLEEIKEMAKVNPGKALQQCSQIEVPDLKDTCIGNIGEVQKNKNYCKQIIDARIKDLCYSNIAKSINDNSLCGEISIDSRKDSCYMTFVLDNKDYSVCSKITNKHLRQSCESLRRLSELNELSQQQEMPQEAPEASQ